MATRPGSAVLALGAAFLLVLAPTAAGAAKPKVTKTAKAPLVAAQGDTLSVTATVAGTGARIKVGLVLGNAKGSPKGGLKLGTGVTISHRGSKKIVVKGKVPLKTTAGQLRTLLVCIDPAKAVKGKSACKLAAKIATSGRSAEERIAGALKAKRITKAQETLYGLYALSHDPRLPVELRGDTSGPGGDQDAIKDAANSFSTLPAAIQKQVFPYFVPPQAGGSAWQYKGRNWKPKTSSSPRRATADAANCTGYSSLDIGTGPAEDRFPWTGVPTSDNKAIVWYGTTETPAFEHYEVEDAAAAAQYAAWMPDIWDKLTDEFGEPQSDAGEECYHGPDGKFDIYVGGSIVAVAGGFTTRALAVTAPYPAVGNYPVVGKWCTDRPAWIAIKPGLSKWALAHEFMHAIQFSHRYTSCDEPIAWWDEGGANWAADFVEPDDNAEQKDSGGMVKGPLSDDLSGAGYEAWPFWMMLEETSGGTGVLNSIFTQLQTKKSPQAVDAAVSGGLAKQVPEFFLHVYNQSPIGDPGFSIDESFKAWDDWSQTPTLPAATTVNLGALPQRTLNLKIQRPSFPALSAGSYHRVKLPDDNVREVQFKNLLFGKPGAHVDALVKRADGSWKREDWTSKKTVTFCRDDPAQDVRELVILSTNASFNTLAGYTHTLKVRSSCPRTYKIMAATLNETFTGHHAVEFIPGCVLGGTQTNTMSLGPQPFVQGMNYLLAGPAGHVGVIIANGTKAASTSMNGCDLMTASPCSRMGSGTMSASVYIQVTIPKNSPTAEVQWFLTEPNAGLGSEGAGSTCFCSPIGTTLDDQSIGKKTVPSAIFQSDTPQTISIDVDFDLALPGGLGGTISASETHSLTIQRVNDDGSPLG